VAHTCDPSDAGGRDQEDHGLKPVHETLSRKTHHRDTLSWTTPNSAGCILPLYTFLSQ
jgi:hypothetical protein